MAELARATAFDDAWWSLLAEHSDVALSPEVLGCLRRRLHAGETWLASTCVVFELAAECGIEWARTEIEHTDNTPLPDLAQRWLRPTKRCTQNLPMWPR